MKRNFDTVVANASWVFFPPLLFLSECCITQDKMGKENREVKELGTKQNVESWLQHKDKSKDNESMLALPYRVLVNKPLNLAVNLLSRL